MSFAISAAAASPKSKPLMPVPTAVPHQGEPIHAFQRILDALKTVSKYTGVSRPLLPKRKRCGVHIRAPDLNDFFPLLGIRCDRIAQRV